MIFLDNEQSGKFALRARTDRVLHIGRLLARSINVKNFPAETGAERKSKGIAKAPPTKDEQSESKD